MVLVISCYIQQRILFNVFFNVFLILGVNIFYIYASQPSYLRQQFTIQPSRSTRSLTLIRPSVTSSLTFYNLYIAIAVPPLWNKLPPVLRQTSDPFDELTKTSPLAISPQLLHSKLKTQLFNKSYPDSSSSPYLLPISTPNTTHLSV